MRSTVEFNKNDVGFSLRIGDRQEHLNYQQATSLLSQLLTTIPGLPHGVRSAWEVSVKPRVQFLRLFTAVNGEVVQSGLRGEVTVCDRRVASHVCDTTSDLATCIYDNYGELDVAIIYTGIKDDPISLKLAEKLANQQIVDTYCEEHGISRADLEKLLRNEVA